MLICLELVLLGVLRGVEGGPCLAVCGDVLAGILQASVVIFLEVLGRWYFDVTHKTDATFLWW